jgi:hypothetical protein
MTQAQFSAAVRRTERQIRAQAQQATAAALERWKRALGEAPTKEARKQARAATGLIFVRQHTVPAYWRRPAATY